MPLCYVCLKDKPKIDFNKRQLKRKDERKCKICSKIFELSKDIKQTGIKISQTEEKIKLLIKENSIEEKDHDEKRNIESNHENNSPEYIPQKRLCGSMNKKNRRPCKNPVSSIGEKCHLHGGPKKEKEEYPRDLYKRISNIDKKEFEDIISLWTEFPLEYKLFSKNYKLISKDSNVIGDFLTFLFRRLLGEYFTIKPEWFRICSSKDYPAYIDLSYNTEDILKNISNLVEGKNEINSDRKILKPVITLFRNYIKNNFDIEHKPVFNTEFELSDRKDENNIIFSSNHRIIAVGNKILYFIYNKDIGGEKKRCLSTCLAYSSVSILSDKYEYIEECYIINFYDGSIYKLPLTDFNIRDRHNFFKNCLRIDPDFKIRDKDYECQICFEKDDSKKPIKCGHWLCNNCKNNIQDRSCPFCRYSY